MSYHEMASWMDFSVGATESDCHGRAPPAATVDQPEASYCNSLPDIWSKYQKGSHNGWLDQYCFSAR
ncbi:hypothetical protein FRX31_026454 [Thalictrum thalictroides]|uniref:Uncharacterized protein n=1 Tax=Thalictrum thalictroides TaxID=46969 RepID=A0A7J6VGD4_THATH|nr:hypothetical protein FRX31_026454 [Thalictrum thalictroides]